MSCMAAWKIDLADGRADPGSRRFGLKSGWGACGSFSWYYLQHITNRAGYLYCIPTILIIPETGGTSHRRTRFHTESIEAAVSHAFVRSRCRNVSLLRPPFPLAPRIHLLSRRPDLLFPLPSVNCTIPNTCRFPLIVSRPRWVSLSLFPVAAPTLVGGFLPVGGPVGSLKKAGLQPSQVGIPNTNT